MSNWSAVPIAKLAKLVSGYAFKSAEFCSKGIPVIKIKNVRVGHVDLTDAAFVDDKNLALPDRYHSSPGDILISLTGSHLSQPNSVVGRVARHGKNTPSCLINQRVGKFVLHDDNVCHAGFLYRALSSPEVTRTIALMAHGAASQANVSPKQVESVEISLPSYSIQRRIAGILGGYDDLIEVNQRRIEVLEEMARGLFDEWFLRFRFPDFEQFPIINSPNGNLPYGWQSKKLGELLSIDKGVSYNGAGLTPDGNPMLNLKNFRAGGGFRRDATKPYSGDYKPRHVVKPGDVVVANTDLTQQGSVVASPALVPTFVDDLPILFSHHLYAVRPFPGIAPVFLYHLMLTDSFRAFAKGFAIGTTVLGLPKEGVVNFSFPCPPLDLISDFAMRVSSMHKLVETYNNQIENLRRARDLLLPRLIKGQLSLEAAGHELEEAA